MWLAPGVDHQTSGAAPVFVYRRRLNAGNVRSRVAASENRPQKIIQRSGRELAVIDQQQNRKLIDDLLEFSKTGRKELRKEDIDMHAHVLEVVTEQLHEAPEKASCFDISQLPSANCDQKLIKQVWTNLISNALKYSSTVENPAIKIWADTKGEQTVFHIKDNGVGFDMQYADKLFGVFQRLHSKKEFDGTGVGLALAYRIITKHGWKIWGDAKLNGGATFHFTIPTVNEEQAKQVELNTKGYGE